MVSVILFSKKYIIFKGVTAIYTILSHMKNQMQAKERFKSQWSFFLKI